MSKKLRSREELEHKVEQLRERLSDVIANDPKFDDYYYLVQWLKRQQYKLNQTEACIRESIEWKKVNNINSLADVDLETSFPGIANAVKVDFCANTKYGQPVVTINADGADIHGLIKEYGKDSILRYFFGMYIIAEGILLQQIEDIKENKVNTQGLWLNEKNILTARVDDNVDTSLKELSDSDDSEGSDSEPKPEPEMPVGFVAIITVREFSFWNATSSDVIRIMLEASKAGVKYFPCLASSVFLVNSNKFISMAFKLVKPIISSQAYTVDIYDSDRSTWSPILTEDIDPNQLSSAFGGCKPVKEGGSILQRTKRNLVAKFK